MNTSEHMVECYFRLCRGCFTLSDRKVVNGNNRQLDILAYNLKEKLQLHIEVAVTHQMNWCPTRDELGIEFDRKFFGVPPNRMSNVGGQTDFQRGKSYFQQIEKTYSEVGFSPHEVKRVWVGWMLPNESENHKPLVLTHIPGNLSTEYEIEVLSLRDLILPQLEEKIGTANYDDEMLRVMSFMKQRRLQTASKSAGG